jgi:glyoxalase superfamily protein
VHAATPTWITLFLDFAPASHQRGLAFWQDVTGYSVSSPRGSDGEFVTLLPPDADGHLRVQRLGSGTSRVHVDVRVDDVDAAVPVVEGLGARVVARFDGVPFAELASPGGFTFCLVPSGESRRAEPATWSDGQRSIVDQVCLDIPPRLYDTEAAFWRDLTGWEFTGPTDENEFGSLRRPADQPVRFLLQRLDDDQDAVTAHLDLSATDRDAEVARHEQLGARAVLRARQWTVMSDPTGWIYCVTDRDPETGVSRP